MNEKPIVVFTNFWDAQKIIEEKNFLYLNENRLYMINLIGEKKSDKNFSINSIALMHPPIENLPIIKEMFGYIPRLDQFCPTYAMLRRYKENKDWEEYTKKYREILSERKKDIVKWIDSLDKEKIYILCCWENTKRGANCHRQLLYSALSKSLSLKERAFYIYRDGSSSEVYTKEQKESAMDIRQRQVVVGGRIGGVEEEDEEDEEEDEGVVNPFTSFVIDRGQLPNWALQTLQNGVSAESAMYDTYGRPVPAVPRDPQNVANVNSRSDRTDLLDSIVYGYRVASEIVNQNIDGHISP